MKRHLRLYKKAKNSKPRKAFHLLKQALKSAPHFAPAHFLMASLYRQTPLLDKAIFHYRVAGYFNPRLHLAYQALGEIYEICNEPLKAFKSYQKYLKACPTPDATVFLSLGALMQQLKQNDKAIFFFLKALEVDPLNSGVYITLAECLQAEGQLDVALDCCMAMAKIYPERAGLMSMFMGYILEKNSEYAMSMRCYNEAVKETPAYLPWLVKKDFSLPFIAESRQFIEDTQRQMLSVLDYALKGLSPFPKVYPPSLNTLSLSMLQNSMTYTCYHHLNPFPLRSKFGKLTTLMSPYIENAPRIQPYSSKPTLKPYQIGVIFKPENVNMCFAFNGDGFEKLDPELFQITIYGQSGQIASLFDSQQKQYFKAPHISWKVLPSELDLAYHMLANEGLDVLFYTEPFWDPYQYNLAAFKPVKKQITSWMNPGTTGLTQIDYFISSELLETPESPSFYAEKLVCFSSLPTYLKAFDFEPSLTRADFGLDENWHIYASPQNILKFHPDFDFVIEEILSRDPLGHMVLLATNKQQHLCQKLIQRFQARFPHLMSRILFLPQLKNHEFLNLLTVSDIILDPLYYGGGTTSYQALGLGKIILTCPSPYMVGKITAAMYQQMGVSGLNFESLELMVESALDFAHNPEKRWAKEAEIKDKKDLLFEDESLVSELGAFLQKICEIS